MIQNEKVLVSSRKVAEVYGKQHSNIMRDIRDLIELVPEAQSNFILSQYIDRNGASRPKYLMDCQGLIYLISSFTGGKHLNLNKKIIDMFDNMKISIAYSVRDEFIFGDLLKGIFKDLYTVIPQFQVDMYMIDFYIPEFNLAIEYDEEHHRYIQKDDAERQRYIENRLCCDFIRIKQNEEMDGINKILKYITERKQCRHAG